MATVQRWVLPKKGPVEVFSLETTEIRKNLNNNEIRIKVHYSGINFADIFMRLGLYPDAPKYPFTPGYEISGEVVEVGKKVSRFVAGDFVMAGTFFGGYASEIILEDWQVLRIPLGLSLAQACAVPVSFITSYLAVHELARVRNGDQVLIDCASGSLGHLCFELMKDLDVHIVGLTSSPEKKGFIEEKAAKNSIVAMTHQELAHSRIDRRFDFILNSRGGATIKDHYQLLGPCGKLVCVGVSSMIRSGTTNLFKILATVLKMPRFNAIRLMNDNRSVSGVNALRIFEHSEFMSQRLGKINEFDFEPLVDRIFPFKELAAAHNHLQQKKARGKVLIKWEKTDSYI